jgi:hypothetical protein
LASDFEKGRAVTVLGRHYCRRCMAEVVKREKEKKASRGKAPVPGASKEPAGAPTRSAERARATETKRIPRASTTRRAPRKPPSLKVILVIAIIIAILLAFLLAVLLAGPRSR